MKKVLIALFVAIVMVCMTLTASAVYLGDVNNDGKVTASDARSILRHSANLEKVKDSYKHLADINADKKINAADARTALRMSAKLENIIKYEKETVKIETTTEKQNIKTVEEYAVECITEDFFRWLKNPSSLIVNNVKYIELNDMRYKYVIYIDYSAMNGFGGYNTDSVEYYIKKDGTHGRYAERTDYTFTFMTDGKSVKYADAKYVRDVLKNYW